MKKDSTPANAERRAIPAPNLAVTILLVVLLAAAYLVSALQTLTHKATTRLTRKQTA